jgi:hypothetical protein
MQLRVAQTNSRPAAPTISYVVNLASVLGTTNAFVGFTAGTGAGWESHEILMWQLNDAFSPIGAAGPPAEVPALTAPVVLALAALLVAAGIFARRRA